VESISFFGLYASNREDPSGAVANGLVDTAPSTNLSASIE